ncbi:glycosyltransferase family 2 protein [bacterium]|nr:glycosyltransferase family 2 protein [bacterium]
MSEINTTVQLTIGVPTCGRPKALRECIESIQSYVKQPYKLIVLESLCNDENKEFYSKLKNADILKFEEALSPAHARQVIVENCNTEFLLFLDDDNQILPGTLEKMMEAMIAQQDIDLICGAWREHKGYRPVGQFFHEALVGGSKQIYKTFLNYKGTQKMGFDLFKVDGGNATMLCRTDMFKDVSFDKNISFYFELFDFFLSCKMKNKNVYAMPSALFMHYPGKYTGKTLKQTHDPKADRAYFSKKWQVVPKGGLGGKIDYTSSLEKIQGYLIRRYYRLQKK